MRVRGALHTMEAIRFEERETYEAVLKLRRAGRLVYRAGVGCSVVDGVRMSNTEMVRQAYYLGGGDEEQGAGIVDESDQRVSENGLAEVRAAEPD